MKALIYGAGKIGRGFIGLLLAQAGYDIRFVDIDQDLVSALAQRREYPVRIVTNAGTDDFCVRGVDAVDGHRMQDVTAAIGECDIMATSVGVNNLRAIAPLVAAGLSERFALKKPPLNILICENLINSHHALGRLIRASLSHEDRDLLDLNVGLIEASIGCVAPVPTPEMCDGDPLRICVDAYRFLPVDAAGFRGGVPRIERMIPFDPFEFYIKRKLFIHNMGHATCAYLGIFFGLDYVYQACGHLSIQLITRCAMEESMRALCMEYKVDALDMLSHIDDLMLRFDNRPLGDTCARVANDPVRKLGRNDRLIGAAQLCIAHGIVPAYIAIGAAAAIHFHIKSMGEAQSCNLAAETLCEIANLDFSSQLTTLILDQYERLIGGASLAAICERARAQKGADNAIV